MKQPGEMVELLKVRDEMELAADHAVTALLETAQVIVQLRRKVPIDREALQKADLRFRELVAYVGSMRRQLEQDIGAWVPV